MSLTAQKILCPVCHRKPLTDPIASSGWRTHANLGRFYQKCPDNTFLPNALCQGFRWRDDIPRQVLPPDTVSLRANAAPADSDIDQPSGLQMELGATVDGVNAYTLPSESRHTLCAGPQCLGRSRPSSQNQQCTNNACKACCVILSQLSGVSCRVTKHYRDKRPTIGTQANSTLSYDMLSSPIDLTSSQPDSASIGDTPPRQSFARMLSPLHVKKLQENNFEYNNGGQIQHRQDQYRKECKIPFKVKWWYKDFTEPYTFYVAASGHFYHPKDCKTVSSMVGLENCDIYGFYSDDSQEWALTDLPQQVCKNITIYLRSKDVSNCVNGPDQLSSSDGGSRGDVSPIQPARRTEMLDTVHEPITSSQQGSTTDVSSYSLSVDGFEIMPSSQSASLEAPPASTASTHKLFQHPISPRRSEWPFRYTCDMSPGFAQIESEDLKEYHLPKRFEMAFGCRYVKSTYSDNRKVWINTPHHVRMASVAAGHSDDGEWKKLVSKYGKSKNRK